MTTEQRDAFLKKLAAVIDQFETEQNNSVVVGCEVTFGLSTDCFRWNGERFRSGVAADPATDKLDQKEVKES